MKTFNKIALSLCLCVGIASAQVNVLTQTTLSSAALASDSYFTVTSATGINAPSQSVIGSELYVMSPGNPRGEAVLVQSTVGTRIYVARGRGGIRSAFPSGSVVLIGQPNYFNDYDPSGGCTTATTFVGPWVNTKNGAQWLCSTITLSWVPGWNNDMASPTVTAAVASAAGAILPSGPLFHVTGTSAITGFTIPVGFTGGSFSIIPDAIFTTTAAGNIALASTAVVNKLLTFTWDSTNSKFVPSY